MASFNLRHLYGTISHKENRRDHHRRPSPPTLESQGQGANCPGCQSAGRASIRAFVGDAVFRKAESVMAAELAVTLSTEEFRRFLKALNAPFQSNNKMKKALARIGQA